MSKGEISKAEYRKRDLEAAKKAQERLVGLKQVPIDAETAKRFGVSEHMMSQTWVYR